MAPVRYVAWRLVTNWLITAMLAEGIGRHKADAIVERLAKTALKAGYTIELKRED